MDLMADSWLLVGWFVAKIRGGWFVAVASRSWRCCEKPSYISYEFVQAYWITVMQILPGLPWSTAEPWCSASIIGCASYLWWFDRPQIFSESHVTTWGLAELILCTEHGNGWSFPANHAKDNLASWKEITEKQLMTSIHVNLNQHYVLHMNHWYIFDINPW